MERESILGALVSYDDSAILDSIDDILERRFDGLDIEGTIDDLYDPYLFRDMSKVVDRIKRAYRDKEKLVIFGDYDTDGVTSTRLLVHFFTKIGMQVSYRLPDRVKDGYGMKTYFMDELYKLGVSLVITVDCGTRDVEVVDYAKTLGIDIIITDHHSVPDTIPENAIGLLNPKRPDSTYPFDGLCGAGIAFKLLQALAPQFMSEDESREYLQSSIDIVRIGTVADCMNLTSENRIIVSEGLKQAQNSRSRGVRLMLGDKLYEDLDGDTFGFLIGPRLNAPGRLDSPYKAVNLLLNNGPSLEDNLKVVEEINDERKLISKRYFDRALEFINPIDNLLIFRDKEINPGITGIVAGRITEKYHKPSIVFKDYGDKFVGSARAPEYVSIIKYLDKYSRYFDTYGGHKQAAGLTILKDNFETFKGEILSEFNSLDFSKNKKEIIIDKIIDITEFGFGLANAIKKYGPYGIGNPKPILMFRDFEVSKVSYLGKSSLDHIKLENDYGIDILGFGFGEYFDEIKKAQNLDIVFELLEDSWMGRKKLKARVIDIVLRD